MSLFCLVHGSTQNASCWDMLIPELERRGHEIVRMNLPANEPDASATRYAEVIAAAIPADRDDAIVVAHSASGLFLPLVPQTRHVRRLVFLAAVIPQLGKSLRDQVNDDNTMFNPEWLGKDPTKDAQLALKFLFHDCSPDHSSRALTTMRLMFARQALLEICPLTVWPAVPSSYILCTEDRAIQPQWSRRAARERLGVDPIELPGGHCPYASRPAELADALIALE
jgi:pimeloyl-ACP methyl ester carboxylesterase